MTEPWYAKFPGSAPAAHIDEWLAEQLRRLERGDISHVRDAAREHTWRRDFAMNGVPDDVLNSIRRYVDIAADALRDVVQVEAAANALRHARAELRGS